MSKSSKERQISYQEYLRRDYNVVHAPYQPEQDFYSSIKNGDISKVKKLCIEPLSKKEGLGILSENPLRNLKYHFVITTANIARACIESGLTVSEAYDMSDYYILAADTAKSIERIDELHNEMCLAYTKKMNRLQKDAICSKPIVMCIDYIYEHLNTRISMNDLTDITGLSEGYLSRLFKKETGCPVSTYIAKKKIETAKSMLSYSNYSILEISEILAFPSQSYFSKVFKDECGVTPGKYKQKTSSV